MKLVGSKFIFIGFFFVLSFATISLALGPKKSVPTVTAKKLSDGRVELDFKITTKILMNYEAPWELKLTDTGPLEFEQTKWKVDHLEKVYEDGQRTKKEIKKLKSREAHFRLTSKNKVDSMQGTVKYKLYAFVCTDGKTKCFRDVHNNSKNGVKWQVTKK